MALPAAWGLRQGHVRLPSAAAAVRMKAPTVSYRFEPFHTSYFPPPAGRFSAHVPKGDFFFPNDNCGQRGTEELSLFFALSGSLDSHLSAR